MLKMLKIGADVEMRTWLSRSRGMDLDVQNWVERIGEEENGADVDWLKKTHLNLGCIAPTSAFANFDYIFVVSRSKQRSGLLNSYPVILHTQIQNTLHLSCLLPPSSRTD